MKTLNLQILEIEETPNSIHWKKSISRHIIIKLLKVEDKENINDVKEKEKIIKRNEDSVSDL